jgi:hypothetical protein
LAFEAVPATAKPLVQAAAAGQRVTDLARGQYWIHPALSAVVENALLKLSLESATSPAAWSPRGVSSSPQASRDGVPRTEDDVNLRPRPKSLTTNSWLVAGATPPTFGA